MQHSKYIDSPIKSKKLSQNNFVKKSIIYYVSIKYVIPAGLKINLKFTFFILLARLG